MTYLYLKQHVLKVNKNISCAALLAECLVGYWADPGGTAMPGQPVIESEQAPELRPLTKISLISKGAHGPRIRY